MRCMVYTAVYVHSISSATTCYIHKCMFASSSWAVSSARLMNLDISGDIRHPVDYLVELIETKEYKENSIDTMWLDGLIARKAITSCLSTTEARAGGLIVDEI